MNGASSLFDPILRALDKGGVRYLLVGGVAVNLHGFVRATKDIDFMLALDDANAKDFIAAMKSLGFKPLAPVNMDEFSDPDKRKIWRKEKGALVFQFYNPKEPWIRVDVFLQNPINFEAAYERRKVIKMRSFKINLAAIEDMIILKKKAGRPQDNLDISVLRKIKSKLEEE